MLEVFGQVCHIHGALILGCYGLLSAVLVILLMISIFICMICIFLQRISFIVIMIFV